MKTLGKILALVGSISVYFAFAGRPGWSTLFGQKLAVIFGFGAVMALWFGGQTIGKLEPISLRPIFSVLGAFLMMAIFILMLATRDAARQLDRGANKPAEPNAGIALRLAIGHHWPAGAFRCAV